MLCDGTDAAESGRYESDSELTLQHPSVTQPLSSRIPMEETSMVSLPDGTSGSPLGESGGSTPLC